eukprot:8037467-Alexandrium_andersonii.AAC.1
MHAPPSHPAVPGRARGNVRRGQAALARGANPRASHAGGARRSKGAARAVQMTLEAARIPTGSSPPRRPAATGTARGSYQRKGAAKTR